ASRPGFRNGGGSSVNVESRVQRGEGHSSRTVLWAVLAILGLVTMAVSCSKDPVSSDSGAPGSPAFQAATDKEAPAGAPQPGGQLTFGLAAETSGWNPYIGQWAGSAYIVAN